MPKKQKGNTHRHQPTEQLRHQVEVMCGLGLTQEEMATVLDIAEQTLRTHYARELKIGGLKADIGVLANLHKMATGSGPEAGKTAIFWAKVRRRWHEVQRVIHGYDPDMIAEFVKTVVRVLRRELPEACPHCKTKLNLPEKIALQLQDLSKKLSEKLPPSEVVPMPRPTLASDGMNEEATAQE